jgi:hypothetical protein
MDDENYSSQVRAEWLRKTGKQLPRLPGDSIINDEYFASQVRRDVFLETGQRLSRLPGDSKILIELTSREMELKELTLDELAEPLRTINQKIDELAEELLAIKKKIEVRDE